MDPKLMSDFEELEGMADQSKDDDHIDDNDDDEANFRPQQASVLTSAEIYMEVRWPAHFVNMCIL